MFSKKLNPLRIIIYWILFCFIFTIAGIILLGITTPGGEQRPLVFLAFMIKNFAYSVFILSILTIPLYIDWIKKYWFVNLFFLVVSFLMITFIGEGREQVRDVQEQKGSITTTENINGKIYKKTITYFDKTFKQVKSVSFYFENKKDSIWTTYSESGAIIKQEEYKNDSLIRVVR